MVRLLSMLMLTSPRLLSTFTRLLELLPTRLPEFSRLVDTSRELGLVTSEVRTSEALSRAVPVLRSEVEGRLVCTERSACPVEGLLVCTERSACPVEGLETSRLAVFW